jgi:Glu-tRNA(Gln) amidotransferase subunit E-like FAD-binding protein
VHLNDKGRAIPEIVSASNLPEGNDDSLTDIVDNLVEQAIHSKWVEKQRKKVAKQLATTVMFNRKGDKDGSFRTYNLAGKSPAEVIAWATQVAGKPDVTRVLNLLPFEEAFRLLVKVD